MEQLSRNSQSSPVHGGSSSNLRPTGFYIYEGDLPTNQGSSMYSPLYPRMAEYLVKASGMSPPDTYCGS